ncbi:helix-turn-helix domain-containing protein [Lentzea sp. NPDC054927]
MTAIISTPYSRYLGDELRQLRESCTSFTGRAMAIHLGWDPSKVSNIEHGKVRATEVDLVQFMATCGKDLHYYEEFRDRYYNAFDLYFAPRIDNLRTLAMAEAMAEKIFSFEIVNVHGLLQTEGYARELFIDSHIEAPDDIERHVQARMERQTIMRRPNRPECVFYVHELVLRTRLGDAQLMKEQYLRLLHRTHTFRIVPAEISTFRSSLALFEFGKAAPVVYTESDMLQLWAQDTVAIARTKRHFQRLDAVALDEEQSRHKLLEYINGL